jgi:hypothetical protein
MILVLAVLNLKAHLSEILVSNSSPNDRSSFVELYVWQLYNSVGKSEF